jgi:hypothetical protein
MQSNCPFPPGSQVVAYLRDSDGPKQDLSVIHQQGIISQYATENNLIITRIYADSKTGTVDVGRDQFLAMIDYLVKTKPRPAEKGLLLLNSSRLARDPIDRDYYESLLIKHGYTIHPLTSNTPDGLDQADQYFFRKLETYIDAKFIIQLRAKTSDGIQELFRTTGALGGTPPPGFKREVMDLGRRKNGERHLAARWVPDPATWDQVKKAWQMRAAGCTYQEIHDATHIYSSHNSYSTMYRNRIYLGEMTVGAITKPDYVPAMVDLPTWQAVQDFNHRNKSRNNPHNGNPDHSARLSNSDYLLSGLIYCECGHAMNASTIKPTEYEYYRCSRWEDPTHIHSGNIPRAALEQAILKALRERIVNRRSLMLLSAQYEKHLNERTHTLKLERKKYRALITTSQKQLRNLTMVIKNQGQISTIIESIRALEEEIAVYNEKLALIESQLVVAFIKPDLDQLGEMSDYLIDRIKNSQTAELRRLLRGFVSRVEVKKLDKSYEITLDYLNPVLIFSFGEKCPHRDTLPSTKLTFLFRLPKRKRRTASIPIQIPVLIKKNP